MSDVAIRRVGQTQDLLGESPCWDAAAGAVCWIDSLAGVLRRHAVAGEGQVLESHALPAPVGSFALCESGAAVVALQHSFARYDFATRELQTLAGIDCDHPDVRLNDGKCDAWGNFIAGTLQVHRPAGEPAQGGLYRLRPDGTVEVLARGFGLTNGPCFSPDGHTLYVADSSVDVRTIWAYDYAPDGPLTRRRAFVHTDPFGAGPDGATVDAQGFLWTALPRIGKLARFAPDGSLDQLLQMPATHPTSLCFGGPQLATMYVTSISRSTNLTGPLPQDGGLFEVTGLPAPGLPPDRYHDR
jgi:sugar lactone lactonase YvrE